MRLNYTLNFSFMDFYNLLNSHAFLVVSLAYSGFICAGLLPDIGSGRFGGRFSRQAEYLCYMPELVKVDY